MPKFNDRDRIKVPSDAVLLNPKQVVVAYGFSLSYWQELRSRGDGPKWVKRGNRVLYVRSSVEKFLGLVEAVQ